MAADTIRLTDALENQAGFAPFKSATPVSSSEGISVTFNFYAYGGTGGDGIGFFLVNGNQSTITLGGLGGSLGYAPRNDLGTFIPGLSGGYLGIGFDSFGNFSSDFEGRIGGPGRVQNSIAVRGSEANQYRYLAGTQTLGSPLRSPLLDRNAARRRAQIDLTPDGVLSVRIDLNNDGDFNDLNEIPIDRFNVITQGGNEAVPATIRFGFAASTGSFTDIHEVDGFRVTTLGGRPIGGTFTTDLTLVGSDRNDNSTGGDGNDIITGGGGNDAITGGTGNDIITGGTGSDGLSGGAGSDRFVFAGANKVEALRSSTLAARDRVTDFNQREGDRFVLDFDNNLATTNPPRGVFNAGRFRGNLNRAIRLAYADKNQQQRGRQALRADEAVFFRVGSRSFLSVNDGRAPFSPANDLVAEVTGITLRAGDDRRGRLAVGNYFA